MIGLCREYSNSTEIHCVQRFPEPLDLVSAITTDFTGTAVANSSSELLNLYTTALSNTTNTALRQPFTKASAALIITSLVFTPLSLATVIPLYFIEKWRPRFFVPIVIALVDAGLVIAATVLWIFAVTKYDADLGSLPPECVSSVSYNTTELPLSIGYLIFTIAACAKMLVIPVIGVSILVILPFLYVMYWVYWIVGIFVLLWACLLGDDDDNNAEWVVVVIFTRLHLTYVK